MKSGTKIPRHWQTIVTFWHWLRAPVLLSWLRIYCLPTSSSRLTLDTARKIISWTFTIRSQAASESCRILPPSDRMPDTPRRLKRVKTITLTLGFLLVMIGHFGAYSSLCVIKLTIPENRLLLHNQQGNNLGVK